MAQTKYNCPNCRRLIDMKSVACPYCGTANPKQMTVPQTPVSESKPSFSANKTVNKHDDFETPDDIGEELFDSVLSPEQFTPNIPNEEEIIAPHKSVQTNKKQTTDHDQATDHSTLSSHTIYKEKINWEDEKNNQKEHRTEKKTLPNGKYNANYDGYYDDITPKIANEVDKILANREKLILKIIGGIAAIFATIVYFVVTLN